MIDIEFIKLEIEYIDIGFGNKRNKFLLGLEIG